MNFLQAYGLGLFNPVIEVFPVTGLEQGHTLALMRFRPFPQFAFAIWGDDRRSTEASRVRLGLREGVVGGSFLWDRECQRQGHTIWYGVCACCTPHLDWAGLSRSEREGDEQEAARCDFITAMQEVCHPNGISTLFFRRGDSWATNYGALTDIIGHPKEEYPKVMAEEYGRRAIREVVERCGFYAGGD